MREQMWKWVGPVMRDDAGRRERPWDAGEVVGDSLRWETVGDFGVYAKW